MKNIAIMSHAHRKRKHSEIIKRLQGAQQALDEESLLSLTAERHPDQADSILESLLEHSTNV